MAAVRDQLASGLSDDGEGWGAGLAVQHYRGAISRTKGSAPRKKPARS